MHQETAFERPRGVHRIETRDGFSQVHVAQLTDRAAVLAAVAAAGVSIDFVKITPSGLSFIIPQSQSDAVSAALADQPGLEVRPDCSIVLVHAVNIRDEEGLIAKIVRVATEAKVVLDHIGDMHDRLLLVVPTSDAARLSEAITAAQDREGWVGQVRPSVPFVSPAQSDRGNRIKVMKFGGTSVASAKNRMLAALKVVSAREQGYQPVVVVSAIGRKGDPYATDTLIAMLKEIDPNIAPDAREVDLLMGCGEILSSVIFAHTLKSLGQRANSFRGGQAGIRTDGVFGNARIASINPVAIFSALEQGIIPVVCGFQGVYVAGDGLPGGELTTLGRGGSDTRP